MQSVVVVIVVLTGGEQGYDEGMSEDVKREITQGLQEGHGVDKGVAVSDTCVFYDFETCEGINLQSKRVRCMSC